MIDKYRRLGVYDPPNSDYWFEMADGEIIDRDYPTPYGSRFFRFFLQGVFGSGPNEALHFLRNQFLTVDTTDREYIELLLVQAEEEGLFSNGTVFYADGLGGGMAMSGQTASPLPTRSMAGIQIGFELL